MVTRRSRVISGPAGGGTYVNQVDIPITVTQPAPTNTAPSVSVTGVADGATYEKSSTPAPGCSVVDPEDTGESATPQMSNGAYDAIGSHTVNCSYTDGGGLTGSANATYTVVRDPDVTAPVVSYTLNPATPNGDNGWYTSNVTLDWTVTEADSAETLETTGCVDQAITADQAANDVLLLGNKRRWHRLEVGDDQARQQRPGRHLPRRGLGRCGLSWLVHLACHGPVRRHRLTFGTRARVADGDQQRGRRRSDPQQP